MGVLLMQIVVLRAKLKLLMFGCAAEPSLALGLFTGEIAHSAFFRLSMLAL
jgi:malonyl CoA-acyl carrier protein transacylase